MYFDLYILKRGLLTSYVMHFSIKVYRSQKLFFPIGVLPLPVLNNSLKCETFMCIILIPTSSSLCQTKGSLKFCQQISQFWNIVNNYCDGMKWSSIELHWTIDLAYLEIKKKTFVIFAINEAIRMTTLNQLHCLCFVCRIPYPRL